MAAIGDKNHPVFVNDHGHLQVCDEITPSGAATIKRYQSAVNDDGEFTWFEVWPDGWVRQGGRMFTTASEISSMTEKTIWIPIKMKTINYTLAFGTASSGKSLDNCHVLNEVQGSRFKDRFGYEIVDVNGSSKDTLDNWSIEGYRDETVDIPAGYTEVTVAVTGGGSGGGSTVVGSIVPYGGTDTPDGFLYCDGSEVSKESYADLYAVIGNTFGTATDPLKFKLPKINDARYLQGNTTPGQEKSEELPNIKGSFWGGLHDTNYGYEGCFTMTGANRNGNNTADENNPQVNFDASLSSSIYKDGGAVQPKSVTIRYLICWKKTIAKVDTLISVPDWSSKVKYDLSSAVKSSYAKTYEGQSFTFTRMTTFTVPEPGFINAMSMAQNRSSYSAVEINGKLIEINSDCDGCDGLESNFVPVDTGDVVTLYSTENDYLKRWVDYYPAKATPSKLSELYMGAPDYSATWTNFLTLASGAKSTGGTYNVEANGFVRVYAGNNNYGASTSSGWDMKINDKIVVSNYCSITDAPELNSIVPVSKGDVVTWTAITAGSAGGVTFDFIPRKKIQIDASDVIATGGGVIDGTLLEPENHIGSFSKTSTRKFLYEVKNDCFLVIVDRSLNEYGTLFTAGDTTNVIGSISCVRVSSTSTLDSGSIGAPIKKGTRIYAASISGSSETSDIYVYEYKLTALAPQIAMPDYAGTASDITSGTTISGTGWLLINVTATSSNASGEVKVGDRVVWTTTEWVATGGGNTYHDIQPGLIPVSNGDVVTYSGTATFSVKLLPCKIVQQTNYAPYVVERKRGTSDNGSVWWYTLWSDGYCEQGGRVVDPVSDVPGGGTYVTLPKPYIDLNYTVNMSTCGYRSTDPKNATYISSVWFEKTRFVAIANGTVLGFTWRAEGYVA